MTPTGIRDMTAAALVDWHRYHHQQPIELAVSHTSGSLAYGAANIRRNPDSMRWLPITGVTTTGDTVEVTAGNGRVYRFGLEGCYTPLVVKVVA